MNIKLHEDVYKVQDPRIKRIMTGAMSLETFVASIGSNDPFVLIHDTVYVMTEQEYYSTRAVYPTHKLMDHMFTHILGLKDLSKFSEEDRKTIEHVKNAYPTCPVCQHRKYKRTLYEIGLKYNLQSELGDCKEIIQKIPRYPEVKGTIHTNVSLLLSDFHEIPPIKRKGCIACVEKHLSQAYILAGETVMGYPEHLVLVVGHLNEAIHELPDEAFMMKQTLELCAAKTVESDKAFVPLWAILSQLLWVRRSMEEAKTEDTDDQIYDVGLDFTPGVENDYRSLSPYLRQKFDIRLERTDEKVQQYKKEPTELHRFEFSGLMASTAEMIASQAPALANMLRDRRLAFVAAPDLMDEAGYGIKDLLKQLHSGLSVRIDLGVKQRVADDAAGVLKSE